MKTKYITPRLEVLHFYAEDAVLLSVSNTKVDTKKDGFEQRSNKKDMWDNDHLWNK